MSLPVVYVTLFRGTPLLLQILFIYFALPTLLDITLDSIPVGILALSLNCAAYLSEIFRARISSIPKGQSEAAKALGLSYNQTMFKIIIPQTYRRIIPPVVNEFSLSLKKPHLSPSFSLGELLYVTPERIGAKFLRPWEVYFSAAGYLIMKFSPAEYYGRSLRALLELKGGILMSQKKNEVILKINHLEKSFGGNLVLKDISAEINKGEVVVVIGPSGSGKSTFLRCLNYLEVPSKGDIYFGNSRIGHGKKERELDLQRSQIGMVFQSFNLFAHLRVLENLTIAPLSVFRCFKEEAHQRAHHYLQKVGLLEKIHTYPGNFLVDNSNSGHCTRPLHESRGHAF